MDAEKTTMRTRVANAKAGDRAALTEILETHAPFVRRMLYRLIGPSQELDDLQQMVFVEVLRALPKYREEAALSTWIGGICVNVAKEHIRGQASSRVRSMAMGDGFSSAALGGRAERGSPEAHLELRQCAAALDKLSINQRTAFVLKAIMGHSIEEVAAMTHSAVSTTRLRLYYARKNFARAMGASLDEPRDAAVET